MSTSALRTLKIVVGGEGNVGKTSLIRRYAKEFVVGDQRVKLALWDIEGQAGNRPNFYLGARAALLVYDVTEPRSLEALAIWVERVKLHAPDTPFLVASNKIDLPAKVPDEWGTTFARYVGAAGFARTSAKDDLDVTPTFAHLAHLALTKAMSDDDGPDGE